MLSKSKLEHRNIEKRSKQSEEERKLVAICKKNWEDALISMPSISPSTSVVRPTHWDVGVEEAYRFQQAGYRDEAEYRDVQKTDHVDRWPHNGFVKKLVGRNGCFYYYNKARECPDAQIHKTNLYAY